MKKKNWDSVFDVKSNVNTFIDFALGKSNFRDLEESVCDYVDRHFVRSLRNGGTVRARQLTRKALKRRGILNKYNLVEK